MRFGMVDDELMDSLLRWFCGWIGKQMNFIKNFNSQTNSKGDGEDKHVELKRYCEKFLDIMKQELIDLLSVIKINFNPSKRDSKADLSWEKMQFSIENHIQSIRDGLNSSTFYPLF